MKNISYLIVTLAALSVSMSTFGRTSGAQAENPPATPYPGDGKQAASMMIARSSQSFGVDLFQRLGAKEGNLFISPYSIDGCLAMAYAGARGQTAEEMAKTLHLDSSKDVADGFAELNTAMIAPKGPAEKGGAQPFTLVVANALFGQKGYPFNPSYLDVLASGFNAPLQEVDFAHARDAAAGTINQWVEKKTNDKIKDLVQPAALNDLTRLVLVNAIYFKSNWAKQFEKSATQDAPFHLSGGKDVTAPMMHLHHGQSYQETDDFQAVELPYSGYQTSMVLIVPKKVDGLAEVEKKFTDDVLAAILKGGAPRDVDLYLPRFKMTDSRLLADDLKAMGMPDAFELGKADFSGISNTEKMKIDQVIHKTYVDVNEEGTEAAAATAAVMVGSAMRRNPEEPVVVRADHPFLFLIVHKATGTVLFMGRLSNPKNYLKFLPPSAVGKENFVRAEVGFVFH